MAKRHRGTFGDESNALLTYLILKTQLVSISFKLSLAEYLNIEL